jgi:hypothetical protein
MSMVAVSETPSSIDKELSGRNPYAAQNRDRSQPAGQHLDVSARLGS